MILETLSLGQLQTNCYIIAAGPDQAAAVIDPGGSSSGAEAPRILETLHRHGLTVKSILLTHYHFDHVGSVMALREATGAEVCIHEREAALLADPPALFRFFAPSGVAPITADRLLTDGEQLIIGEPPLGLTIEYRPTPGHSPGGLSFYLAEQGVVFCGDALFRGGVGRTDFPGCSAEQLARSIREQLYTLPPETVAYPGHGPETTIGVERQSNPFVRG